MRSFCLTYYSTLFVWLRYSSCSSYYFLLFHSSCSITLLILFLLLLSTSPFLLLNLLFHSFLLFCSSCLTYCSSYSTCYFAPLVWPTTFLLFDLLLFLLDLLFYSSYLTNCFAPLAWHVVPSFLFDQLCSSCSTNYIPLAALVASLFLFDRLLHSSCSTYCSIPLT